MLKLLRIFTVIEKYYPEVATPEIKAYCTEADAPETERTGQFELGYNSLKWALCSVNDINPDAVKNLFRDILFEFYARQLPFQQIEINILTFSAIYPYKAQLKQRSTVDISTLGSFSLSIGEGRGEAFFIINESTQNLTSKIFRETQADAIIFNNQYYNSAGIIFRVKSKLNNMAGFKNYLLDKLSACEPGWTTIGEDMNTIINYGKLPENLIDTNKIIEIIKTYNW
jgi:hypothetical protein